MGNNPTPGRLGPRVGPVGLSSSILLSFPPPTEKRKYERRWFLVISSWLDDDYIELQSETTGSKNEARNWKLHYLDDDTGEEKDLPQAQETDAKNQQVTGNRSLDTVDRKLLEKDTLIAEKDRQLGEITHRLVIQGKDLAQARLDLATTQLELTDGADRLVTQHQELAQIRLELVEARSHLVETQDALCQLEDRLASRDAQLARIKEQLNGGDGGDSLARQKEMDEMRARIQVIEQFMSSQVSKVLRSRFWAYR
ncbi:hypothetical protein FRC09_009447 [Ceratobasidium sp. 395]|nr:hypothetical protein FRC09_009447 [Ceratobasidium sp. 395]